MQYVIAALTVSMAVFSSHGANATSAADGLYVANVVNGDCKRAIQDYKLSAARGMAAIAKSRKGREAGTADSEPGYLLVKGRTVSDTSFLYDGKIIAVLGEDSDGMTFKLKSSADNQIPGVLLLSIKRISNGWVLTNSKRGKSASKMTAFGPVRSTICKLQ